MWSELGGNKDVNTLAEYVYLHLRISYSLKMYCQKYSL